MDTSPTELHLARLDDYHGESGLQRLVFAGLSETDDPTIRAALGAMYRRFHRFIREQISSYRREGRQAARPDVTLSAWAIIGLGTLSNIVQELDLLGRTQRRRFIGEVGQLLIDGRPS